MVPQHAGAGRQRIGREDRRERFQHIATARMGDYLGDRSRATGLPQPGDRAGRQFRHGAMEEIAEFAVALLETQFVPVGGQVEGIEIKAAQARWSRGRAPDRGRGAVAEQAGTDEHARVVIQVKGR